MDEWLRSLKMLLGNWPEAAKGYFIQNWGLETAFAVRAATLYAALSMMGLNPRITSGFRDPDKQREMRARWDRGDRAGLRVRPADPDASQHCKEALGGSPASRAIDMPCSNDEMGARVARALGLRAGFFFQVSDPGHYDAG